MTTPSGAVVAPNRPVVQGEVIQPTAIVDAASEALHGFVSVVRKLVTNSPAFHSESDMNDALAAVDKFSKNQIPASVLRTIAEQYSVAAPREDVSQRVPPQTGIAQQPVLPNNTPIDYNRLAQAIVAVQQQQASQAEPPVPGA